MCVFQISQALVSEKIKISKWHNLYETLFISNTTQSIEPPEKIRANSQKQQRKERKATNI